MQNEIKSEQFNGYYELANILKSRPTNSPILVDTDTYLKIKETAFVYSNRYPMNICGVDIKDYATEQMAMMHRYH